MDKKEKMEDKFNLHELEEVSRKLNEIQSWSVNHSGDTHLLGIIDGLCRVANMYNMVIKEEIVNGHISTFDPEDYIKNKLREPYEIIKLNQSK